MADESIPLLPMTRFRIAMLLAILADALQMIFFPLFVEGAESPVDDALDLGVGAALFFPIGLALGVFAICGGQTGPRSRSDSVLDDRGR